MKNTLTRIGVFYDGNYFLHVSNYYNYIHERRSRISINGLHEFIRRKVAELEGNEYRLCQIVDAHYSFQRWVSLFVVMDLVQYSVHKFNRSVHDKPIMMKFIFDFFHHLIILPCKSYR